MPNCQKPPKAEERKMDWESVSHGSHGSHVDSHDSLARWLAVCQDPVAPLRIFVSSGAVHCFEAAAKVKFQTGQNLSVNLSVLTNRQNLSVVGLSVHVS